MSDGEEKSSEQIMMALIVLPVAVMAIIGFATTKLPGWAYRNYLLVDSAEALVTLPGGAGYGLDWCRLLLVLVVLVAAGALAFAKARESLKSARQPELNTDEEMSRDEAEFVLRMGKHTEKLSKKWWDDLT